MIALVGVGPCFALNALSFGAMLVALRAMDPAALHDPRRAVREPGQLRAAFALRPAHARRCGSRSALMALVGTLSFNFQVLLPLLASFSLARHRRRPTRC